MKKLKRGSGSKMKRKFCFPEEKMFDFWLKGIKERLSEKTLSLYECNLLREELSLLESIDNHIIEADLLKLDYELYEYKKMIYKINKEDDLFISEIEELNKDIDNEVL